MTHKVAIIGVGDRGSVYTRACIAAGLEIASIYDIDPKRIDTFFERFGDHTHPQVAASLEECLSSEADIAIIAVPAYYHCDYAMAAMEHGKHVLSEKPFDLDLAKVARLGEVARRTGRKFAVGHQYHNFRNVHSIKTMFEKDMLGRPAMLRFSDQRERRPKIAMHDAEHGNCGPMMDMSCHYIDIMRWCFESRPVKVTAKMFTYAKGDPRYAQFAHQAPDTGTMLVEFESGDVGLISLTWGIVSGVGAYSPIDGFGPKGMIKSFELWNSNDAVCFSGTEGEKPIEFSEEELAEFEFPEKTTLLALVSDIDGTGEVQVRYEDAMLVFATSMAGLKSAATGEPVLVDDVLRELPKTIDFVK